MEDKAEEVEEEEVEEKEVEEKADLVENLHISEIL